MQPPATGEIAMWLVSRYPAAFMKETTILVVSNGYLDHETEAASSDLNKTPCGESLCPEFAIPRGTPPHGPGGRCRRSRIWSSLLMQDYAQNSCADNCVLYSLFPFFFL
jgi:hypothetical protein